MTAYFGSVSLFLEGDATIATQQWVASDGTPFVVLRIGPLTVDACDASPATLRQLAACASELADVREQQLAAVEGGGRDV
ncbi:hypothetical protein [Streptomyces sp. H27-D2]|uniref:hypothetical protein n=1 Tax=Streptomyces sp. H27-D2 TaxID=3046304 RepID=UPI002DBD2C12|nr:hypothetical protein [Streptomyces sp. H27-D2]MEC4016009.1 hypothetical protein [Streptomyces sp. H27-D2]